MDKQCGNCKWFDSDGLDLDQHEEIFWLACNYPLPISVDGSTSRCVRETEGENCQVWEERKIKEAQSCAE